MANYHGSLDEYVGASSSGIMVWLKIVVLVLVLVLLCVVFYERELKIEE